MVEVAQVRMTRPWLAAVASVAWVVGSAATQFYLGWSLPVVGQSVGGALVWILLAAVGFAAIGLAFGTGCRRIRHTSRPYGRGWVTILVVGSVGVMISSTLWTTTEALHERVASQSSQLNHLLQLARAAPVDHGTKCIADPEKFPPVPGLGRVTSVCFGQGTVAFTRGVGNNAYGYFWGPPPTPCGKGCAAPIGEYLTTVYGMCIANLSGPWWEYTRANVSSCPLGFGGGAFG